MGFASRARLVRALVTTSDIASDSRSPDGALPPQGRVAACIAGRFLVVRTLHDDEPKVRRAWMTL